MKVRYRVVPKQNKKSSFYVNCHSQHVTIQAADSAFSTLLSLRERLSAWYKEKNISFDDIPTNTDTACCFAWKVDTETGEGLDTYYYGGGCGVMNSDTPIPKQFNDVTIAETESEIVANGY